MYFEVHMIIRRPLRNILGLRRVVKDQGWWMSEITKDSGNDEIRGDIILTTRKQTEHEAIVVIEDMTARTFGNGKLIRYKIEQCTVDSNVYDTLRMLKWHP